MSFLTLDGVEGRYPNAVSLTKSENGSFCFSINHDMLPKGVHLTHVFFNSSTGLFADMTIQSQESCGVSKYDFSAFEDEEIVNDVRILDDESLEEELPVPEDVIMPQEELLGILNQIKNSTFNGRCAASDEEDEAPFGDVDDVRFTSVENAHSLEDISTIEIEAEESKETKEIRESVVDAQTVCEIDTDDDCDDSSEEYYTGFDGDVCDSCPDSDTDSDVSAGEEENERTGDEDKPVKQKKPKGPKVKFARQTGHLVQQIPTPTCTGNVAPTLMATGYASATYKNFYSVGHFPKLGILELWEDDEETSVVAVENTDEHETVMDVSTNKVLVKNSDVNAGDKIKEEYGTIKRTRFQEKYENSLF